MANTKRKTQTRTQRYRGKNTKENQEIVKKKAELEQAINELYKKENDTIKIEKKELNRVSKTRKTVKLKKPATLLVKILFLLVFYYFLFGVVFGAKRMKGSIMSPSLTDGDLLLYYRLDKSYNTDDIVILNNKGEDLVLRVVAKEGQTVDIDENGRLLVDNTPEEHIIFYETKKSEDANIKYPYKVERGKVFVMGDYRKIIKDSRAFGAIDKKNIKGKLIGKFQIRNL